MYILSQFEKRNIGNLFQKHYYVICSNMDGPRDYHTKQGKSDKDKYHMTSPICAI